MAVKIVSPKAELAVLRGMTHRDAKISGTLISSVDETYFHSPESLEIYEAIMRNLRATGKSPRYKLMIEDPELSDEARDHFRDSNADIQTVSEAAKASNILNKYRQKRGLFNLSVDIARNLEKSKVDVDDLLHRAGTAVNVIRAKKAAADDFVHFGKNNSSMTTVREILYGDRSEDIIPTGIEAFDSVSGGFARGALVTIAANSGGGKSILSSALAVKMVNRGYKVLLVPLEMSKEEMTCRIMANVTNTDFSDLWLQRLSMADRERIERKFKKWIKKVKAKGGRYTIFKPKEDLTIEETYASVNAYDCDVCIIDYISLLKGVDGDDQAKALGRVARYGKINAENTKRVNVLVCQLTDDGKIKYSRAITEHSANSWVFMATKETKETGITKVEQPKSRNSLSFPFMIRIDYSRMRVYSVDQSETSDSSLASIKKGKNKELANLASDVD